MSFIQGPNLPSFLSAFIMPWRVMVTPNQRRGSGGQFMAFFLTKSRSRMSLG